MKKIKILLGLVLVVAVGIIALIYQYGPNYNLYIFPPSPQKYGKIALNIINSNGLYTDTEEWNTTKKTITSDITKAKSYNDVLTILNDKINIAGGKHSFITTATELSPNETSPAEMPTYEVQENVLILRMPSFSGTLAEAEQYAGILAQAIHEETFDGVIIDMSLNSGGDMSPMIVGLSQLLPDGELFSFTYRNGSSNPIILSNGSVNAGGFDLKLQIDQTKLNVPIALVTGAETGSSGEMTLLSFRGLQNTRTFGQNTAGYATVNQSFWLYDGSSIQITCGNVTTRTGEVMGEEPIQPDVTTETAYELALDWIEQNK